MTPVRQILLLADTLDLTVILHFRQAKNILVNKNFRAKVSCEVTYGGMRLAGGMHREICGSLTLFQSPMQVADFGLSVKARKDGACGT